MQVVMDTVGLVRERERERRAGHGWEGAPNGRNNVEGCFRDARAYFMSRRIEPAIPRSWA